MGAGVELQKLIGAAVEALKSQGTVPADFQPKVGLDRPAHPEHGDFATNLPLTMAREAKMAPRELAELLVANLPASELLAKAEVAGPGFINFFVSGGWLSSLLAGISSAGKQYGRSKMGAGAKVQVEFVSANPTGPLHVGSGRNAAYGDALARLLEAAGYDVQREFYVNDAGNQVDRFTKSLEVRYLQALGRNAEFPEDGYQGDYLVEFGRELAIKHGDALEGRFEELRALGLKRVLMDQQATLEAFGVTFDSWFSEQTLHSSGMVKAALDRLEKAGLLYENDGATWFRATQLGAPRDQVVLRSGPDRTPTYLAADAAYLVDKIERGFDRVIYVWGADHHGNVAGLKAVAKAFGCDDRVEVLLHQLVSFVSGGTAVKMSRRAGSIVTLDELLNEVGADAAKFILLSRSIDMTIDFDLEVAKSQSPENPVYYAQYQHARACSVLRQAHDREMDPTSGADIDATLLSHHSEIELMRKLSEFPSSVEDSARLRAPHRLTHYAQASATLFSAFYRDCRVITEDPALTGARLALVDCARQVAENCLGLLGVHAPERM